ncbi:MAG: 16S rRNA (guanine(966)-N(2))-methyltransferase RsmD [Actinomycetota bacterium]|nr:16S rRNA (guanine(966)-N(2))-methyltransferase RsmD [Actinomycetota bacterium]
MRVIAGEARGRPLRSPATPGVRPTSDRVREAMFDVLGSLGVVDGADVLDAFAGSGALGIEALSRGARSVTFVDSSRDAVRSVEDNLERVGFSGRREVRVVRMDVLAFLASSVASYDVALLDPPYRFDAWEDVLATIDARVVVAESRAPVDVPDRFELHRVYRYGGTLVTVASESGRPASARGGRTAPEGSS